MAHTLIPLDARYATGGNTFAHGEALMKSAAEAYHNPNSNVPSQRYWDGWCESAAVRFVGSPGGFTTAFDAAVASTILSDDHTLAVHGCVHFYRDTATPEPGHVSISMGGSLEFMATAAIEEAVAERRPGARKWHTNLGVIQHADYEALRPNLEYLGWAQDLGGTVISDLILVCKVDGDPRLWLMNHNKTRHHLTPAQWKPLKAKGVGVTVVDLRHLERYPVA